MTADAPATHADASLETTGPRPPRLQVPGWVPWLPKIGLLVVAADLAVLGFVYLTMGQERAGFYLAACGQLFLFGKEGSIPIDIFLQHTPALLAGVAIVLTDVAFVLLTYPLYHLGMEALATRRGPLGAMLRDAQARAVRHKKFVDRFGLAALAVFMLVPGPMSSPPMGAVLGRLAGLAPLPVLFVILFAICATTIVWTSVYVFVIGKAGEINQDLPIILSIIITASFFTYTVVSAIRSHRREKAHAATAEKPSLRQP
jgi:uncharacterized membrane protein